TARAAEPAAAPRIAAPTVAETRLVEPAPTAPAPRSAEPAPVPPPVRPALAALPAERLSSTADHEELLRELAERLNARKATSPANVAYAGFFVRALAFLIDGLVLGLFAFPLAAGAYLGIRAGLFVLGSSTPFIFD